MKRIVDGLKLNTKQFETVDGLFNAEDEQITKVGLGLLSEYIDAETFTSLCKSYGYVPFQQLCIVYEQGLIGAV